VLDYVEEVVGIEEADLLWFADVDEEHFFFFQGQVECLEDRDGGGVFLGEGGLQEVGEGLSCVVVGRRWLGGVGWLKVFEDGW
jgi:hypothetical protein